MSFVVAVVAVTVVSLSSSVAQWWTVQGASDTSKLPAAADGMLRARSTTTNADGHTVLWCVAAVALVWATQLSG